MAGKYERSQPLSVGVTGTNGKTTTTTWVASILERVASPVARMTSLGSFIGERPWSPRRRGSNFAGLLSTARGKGSRYAVLEITSVALARGFARQWPSDVGVFTNLTRDHLNFHGSFDRYLASKAELFLCLRPEGTAVLNGCDPSSEVFASLTRTDVKVLRYGWRGRGKPIRPLDVELSTIDVDWHGTTIGLVSSIPRMTMTLKIPSIGEIFAENAVAALLTAVAAGVSIDCAAKESSRLPSIPGRFQVVNARPWVVVDYAHTPDALARTLATGRRLTKGALSVVFGAGGGRDPEKRPEMGAASGAADMVFLTSDNARNEDPAKIAAAIKSGIPGGTNVEVDLNRAMAISKAIKQAGPNDVVIIAGKGDEREQVIGDTRIAFNDAEVARRVIQSGAAGDVPV